MGSDQTLDNMPDVVSEDIIRITKRNGSEILFSRKYEDCGIPRPMSAETKRIYDENKMKRSYDSNDNYLERLYDRALDEIEYYDKVIVLESFRRNRISIDTEAKVEWGSYPSSGVFGMLGLLLSAIGIWKIKNKRAKAKAPDYYQTLRAKELN